jgi:hypothetical protein
MVRVNLFESAGPGVYGTANWRDILSVSSAAALFCLTMVLISFGVLRILEALQ